MVEEPEELVSEEVTKATVTETGRPRPNRSATLASFWPVRMNSKEDKELPQRPPPFDGEVRHCDRGPEGLSQPSFEKSPLRRGPTRHTAGQKVVKVNHLLIV